MAKKKKTNGENSKSAAEMTEAEWTVMKVVWENEPCSAGTVQEALTKSRKWAYSTVKTMMDRMTTKGLLEISKVRNVQLFSSKINKVQASRVEFQRTLSRAFDGALTPMVQYMVENEKLSKDDIAELRKLVDGLE